MQNTGVPEFESDLRVPGVPEEVVQQDKKQNEGNRRELQKILRIGSNAATIREDLTKEDGDLTLSEESQRTTHEMGNVELFEL